MVVLHGSSPGPGFLHVLAGLVLQPSLRLKLAKANTAKASTRVRAAAHCRCVCVAKAHPQWWPATWVTCSLHRSRPTSTTSACLAEVSRCANETGAPQCAHVSCTSLGWSGIPSSYILRRLVSNGALWSQPNDLGKGWRWSFVNVGLV